MNYSFKTVQKKIKGKWTTQSIINDASVPFMLIDDMTAKYIYKANKSIIEKNINGIVVYYGKDIRAIYSAHSCEII